ncbi:unnamed protein product [Brugia pahangi]|uniref:Glutathione peroxidase n=1 Tax=Brugia pahangi TaxID=6280 RepID=A0A0N4U0B0_BRUPA|nr:unnamed protein product [Brugia pahangi]
MIIILFKLYVYRNKVVLIVNVASQCGLTHSNYAQLKNLHDKYKEQGLAIAAFPCNQFASQVVLIVNVASQCGLTHSNYAQLKNLHDKYKEQGLAIAAFPCNQFASQVYSSIFFFFLNLKYN